MKSKFPIFENFLDFAYADIETMSDEELWQLAINVYALSAGHPQPTEITTSSDLPNFLRPEVERILKDLSRTQEYIRTKIEVILLKILARKDLQINLNKFEGGALPHDNPDRPIKLCKVDMTATITCSVEGTGGFKNKKRKTNLPFEKRQISTSMNLGDHFWKNLEYHLYQSINGLQVQALRQCKECNKPFIHTSKRVREYCENKCACRYRMRKSRAEQSKKSPTKQEGK